MMRILTCQSDLDYLPGPAQEKVEVWRSKIEVKVTCGVKIMKIMMMILMIRTKEHFGALT